MLFATIRSPNPSHQGVRDPSNGARAPSLREVPRSSFLVLAVSSAVRNLIKPLVVVVVGRSNYIDGCRFQSSPVKKASLAKKLSHYSSFRGGGGGGARLVGPLESAILATLPLYH